MHSWKQLDGCVQAGENPFRNPAGAEWWANRCAHHIPSERGQEWRFDRHANRFVQIREQQEESSIGEQRPFE